MRRIYVLSALALLVASFASGPVTRAAGLPTLDAGGATAIDRVLQAAVDGKEIPGVVALVTNKDQVLYVKSFGKRDVGKNLPMTNDTMFRIASMTKPITSAAVMMLAEEGKLKLDDPIANYLPAYKDREVIATFNEKDASVTTRPAKGPITIRQLLTQTAGLSYEFDSPTTLALVQARTGKPRTDAPIAFDSKILRELPLLVDPGTEWHYSPATAVLGELVERITGAPLIAFFQTRFFEPLGMADTTYTPAPAQVARLVTIHQRDANGLTENPNPPTFVPDIRGDGGLVSTAPDYANIVQMFLNEGSGHGKQLLKPETVRAMGSNQIGALTVKTMPAATPGKSAPFPVGAGIDTFGFGFQIAMTDGTASHERAAGSYTWAGINNTFFWVDPKSGVGVVFMTQVLPFYNATSMDVMKRFEHAVYEHLR